MSKIYKELVLIVVLVLIFMQETKAAKCGESVAGIG